MESTFCEIDDNSSSLSGDADSLAVLTETFQHQELQCLMLRSLVVKAVKIRKRTAADVTEEITIFLH